ncbi:MAG: DUF5119 domain-containing protein [Bacteroidaceae bacterium]|nr:DUF5119 domain-containing protein [Bacteroidaceae bacterium]MBQ4521283.1 DUF5119 domain-containing protein [Bacteroidaceae bacterium]
MKRILGMLAGTLMTLFVSCEHKELCYDHDPHALKYHINVKASYEQEWQHTYGDATDWKTQWPEELTMSYDDLRPGIPEGLRILSFNEVGKQEIKNMPASGGILSLSEGSHSLLFYNNDTEYIVFDDIESFVTARATTRSRTRSSYMGNSYSQTMSEKTVNAPDMLYGNYLDNYTPEKVVVAPDMDITMHPLVFTYVIKYEFKYGLQYVALARGALAGMAEAVHLNSGKTSNEIVTILYDCTIEEYGAQAVVNSFGIPDYPNENYTRSENKYALNLEVKLKNGIIKNFEFDVTDQVAKQPHGGVIIVSGIEISDDDGKKGGSAFDVDVNDWGEYEDIDIPLL